jgi:uroporphyrinogen decarboxylase
MSLQEPNIERLLKAFALEEPDRVPHFEGQIMRRNIDHILGRETGCNSLWQLDPHDAVEVARRIGQDAITVNLSWNGCGGRWGLVTDWSDLEKMTRPPTMDEVRRKVERYVIATRGTGVGLRALIMPGFTNTYMLLGPVPIQSFMLKVYDDRKLVEHLLDLFLEYALSVVEAVCEYEIAFFGVADDVAWDSGLMVSPDLLYELWVPRAKRLVCLIKEKGFPILFHCCGNLTDVLPILIEWGVDAIHPIQPHCNDIYQIKRRYGDRICLVGNIDLAGPLSFGTPEQVVEETKEHLERLAPGGGYVVASSHSITDSVPPENFLAMVEAVHEHGRY